MHINEYDNSGSFKVFSKSYYGKIGYYGFEVKKLAVPSSIQQIAVFTSPRKTFLGFNSLSVISGEIAAMNIKKLLIVTDTGMVKLGYVDRVQGLIHDMNVEVYDRCAQEPSLNDLEELASTVKERNYDAVLGIGGGSAMDSAKIASFTATNLGPISDYTGEDKIQRKGLPLICVPTTSGTGSEVTRFTVIAYERTKRAIASNLIMPDIAIVDPMLTVSMPPKLTAYTGVDALAHAVEAMISLWATPFTDALALAAIKWVFQYLKRAAFNGYDLEARYHMSLAATTAGLSFNNPRIVLAHSIGQTIGPTYGIPHGLSVALALPYTLDFYLPTSAGKIALISEAAGVYDPEKTEEGNAKALVEKLFQFYQELGLPLSLRELRVPFNALDKLAEDTVTMQPRRNSPIQFTKENLLKVYEKIWKGEV